MIKPQFLPDAEAEFLKEIAYYSNAREGLGIKLSQLRTIDGNPDTGWVASSDWS